MISIGEKARSGFKWSGIQTGLTFGINTLVWITLAFFLEPEEFGQLAIVNFIIGLGEMIANFGISQAIIQKNKVTKSELDSLFWFLIGFGTLLTISIILLAPFIANHYQDDQLSRLLYYTAFYFILSKPPLIYIALLQKHIKFKVLTKFKVSKTVVVAVITLGLAFLGAGAFSVVISSLIGMLFYILIFFVRAYRESLWFPGIYFKFADIKPYLNFGGFVLGKNVLNYVGANFDVLIIGTLLGVDKLGYYHFAKRLIESPRLKISGVFRSVTYPVYSKLININHLDKFKSTYLSMSNTIAIIGFLGFGLIFVTGMNGIPVLFGEKWVDAVYVTQIFSFIAIVAILSDGFASSALYSFGKPNQVMYVDMVFTPIRMLLVYFTSLHSIELVAIGVGLIVFSKSFATQWLLNKISGLDMKTYLAAIAHPFYAFLAGCILSFPLLWTSNFEASYFYAIGIAMLYLTMFSLSYYWMDRSVFSRMKIELGRVIFSKGE